MALILTSISGGIPDPYVGLDGVTEALTFPNAVRPGETFQDRITITPDAPYVKVDNSDFDSRVLITVSGVSQSTISGGTTLNITFEEPNLKRADGGPVEGYTSSVGNRIYTGSSVSGAGPDPDNPLNQRQNFGATARDVFTDKYMEYKDRSNGNAIVRVTSFDDVPSENADIYLYKPSFAKYVYYTREIIADYLTSSNTTVRVRYTVLKRILNDWDVGRDALKAKVAAQNASSN
jgi:hypothetical protein